MSAWPGNEASDDEKWNWLHSEWRPVEWPLHPADQPWLRQKEATDWFREKIKANCLRSLRLLRIKLEIHIHVDELVGIAWEEVFTSNFDLSTYELKSCVINICRFSHIRYMKKTFFFTKKGPQKTSQFQIDILADFSPSPDDMFMRVESAAIAHKAIHDAFKKLEDSKYGKRYPTRIQIAKETLLEDAKPRNIAKLFGVTPTQIATITFRVFEKLRKILKKNPPPGWN